MEYKEVKEALEKFGEAVIASAKVNLKKNDMGGGQLFNSLKSDLTVEQILCLQVQMESKINFLIAQRCHLCNH